MLHDTLLDPRFMSDSFGPLPVPTSTVTLRSCGVSSAVVSWPPVHFDRPTNCRHSRFSTTRGDGCERAGSPRPIRRQRSPNATSLVNCANFGATAPLRCRFGSCRVRCGNLKGWAMARVRRCPPSAWGLLLADVDHGHAELPRIHAFHHHTELWTLWPAMVMEVSLDASPRMGAEPSEIAALDRIRFQKVSTGKGSGQSTWR